MTPPTTVPEASESGVGARGAAIRWLWLLLAVVVIGGAVRAASLLEQPQFVRRITFENPTVYDLAVEVSGSGDDGWMPVWTARRRNTTVAEEIYDIGDRWLFRFSAQGETTSTLHLTRRQLEGDRWRVRIPAAVGDELARKGAPPSP